MTKYVTFKDTDKSGLLQYYILQRAFPHYVAMVASVPMPEVIMGCPVPGYYLWIVFSGNISGNYMVGHKGELENVKNVILDMVDWFLDNRINTDKKRYKKWQFNAPSTS